MTGSTSRLHDWMTQQLGAELVREAVRALGPDLPVMPLKGVLVGRLLYDSPAERPMVDCDLLLLGGSLRQATRRLERAGFEVVLRSRMLYAMGLCSPRVPLLPIDLHARPVPRGLGAIDAAWMREGAREDAELFGVRVWVPEERRLLVHLLANVLKDHVYRANPHSAKDVQQLLARSRWPIEAHAEMISSARLRAGSWMALEWVAEQQGGALARALQRAIGLNLRQERWARWRLERLRRFALAPTPPLRSRLLARTTADRRLDVAVAVVATGAALAVGAVRRRLGR